MRVRKGLKDEVKKYKLAQDYEMLDFVLEREGPATVAAILALMMCVTLAIFIMIALWPKLGFADQISESLAVQCIIGEAENQGLDGMRAHASALRNRGHVRGVYGCKAKRETPEWVFKQAKRAWRDSADYDYVDGADHFGAVGLDNKWIARMGKTMTFVKQVKDVRFYREN